MKNRLLLLIPLALSACATTKPVADDQVNMIDYRIAGNSLPADQLRSVRNPGVYSTKGFGRYVDPQRGDTMYMGGEIVRREQSETFNLRPGSSPTAIRQTSFPPMDPQTALNPAFTAELEQKVELQNKLMSALIEQNKVAEANAKMTAEVADKLARQEAETNALKDKMKSIEEQKQSPATPTKTKPKSWKWWEK